MKATDAINHNKITATGVDTGAAGSLVFARYTTNDEPDTVYLRVFAKGDATLSSNEGKIYQIQKPSGPRFEIVSSEFNPVKQQDLQSFLDAVKDPKDELERNLKKIGYADSAQAGSKKASGAAPAPTGETGPEEELQQFLAQHVDKYFDKIPEGLKSKYTNVADLKPKIAPKGWGPASSAALAGFASYVESGSGAYFDTGASSELVAPLVALSVSGDPNEWKDLTGVFDSGLSGLLKYLKFAYVATRPDGQSGYDAAKEMGIEPKYENSLFPTDAAWQALCRLGAISPFFYFAFAAPADVTIPADATITIDGKAFKHSGAAAGKAAAVALGVNEGDKFPAGAPGNGMGPNMWGEAAADVLKPGNHTVELKIGDKTWSWTGELRFGKVIEFATGAGQAAGVAPGAAAGGYALLPVGRTVTGRTVPTGTKLFTLQNIYVGGDGSPLTRDVPAALTKAPRPRGDLFRVESDTSYILVPVRLPAALREARHWVETLLATPAAGDSGVVYFPVKSFTILNNRNIVDYGPDGAGAPLRVVYEPLDPGSLPGEVPAGIQLLTAGDVDARGRGADGFTPAEWAIANYFLTANNPTGTPLYRTANLNRQINSYPQAQPGRVG